MCARVFVILCMIPRTVVPIKRKDINTKRLADSVKPILAKLRPLGTQRSFYDSRTERKSSNRNGKKRIICTSIGFTTPRRKNNTALSALLFHVMCTSVVCFCSHSRSADWFYLLAVNRNWIFQLLYSHIHDLIKFHGNLLAMLRKMYFFRVQGSSKSHTLTPIYKDSTPISIGDCAYRTHPNWSWTVSSIRNAGVDKTGEPVDKIRQIECVRWVKWEQRNPDSEHVLCKLYVDWLITTYVCTFNWTCLGVHVSRQCYVDMLFLMCPCQ